MSDLPPGWEEISFGELFRLKYGKALPKEDRSASHQFPVVGSAGLMARTHTPLAGNVPTLVIGRKGNIGVVRLYDEPFWPIDTVFYAAIPSKLNPKFVALQLQLTDFQSLNRSTTTPSLRRQELEAVPIRYPGRQEQDRIVETVEDHLSRLDAGIQALRPAEARIKAMRNRLQDDLVLGRLLSTTSGTRENLRGKLNRFDYESLPSLPVDWSWRLAADSCVAIDSGSTPPAELMTPGSGDVPFLKVYNIHPDGFINFSKNPTYVNIETHTKRLSRSVALPGDVLTNIVGPPLGKSAIVPTTHAEWNINQAIVRFRPGPDITSGWLAACLKAPFIIGLLQGTARATAGQLNIALSTCRELPLPVPPQEVQLQLLDVVEQQGDSFDRLQRALIKSQNRASALKRGVLRLAFSGQLVDTQPTDVSLSALQVTEADSMPGHHDSQSPTSRKVPVS